MEVRRRHRLCQIPWVLLVILGCSFIANTRGIVRDLPASAEFDETIFVDPAIRINATGDLNPHWFGNPGSPLIYGLALVYHVENALFHAGPWFAADPRIQNRLRDTPEPFYLAGRVYSALAAVASVSLVFAIGDLAFAPSIGLVGALLFALCPVVVAHAQMVRTDSLATLFGLVALWAILKYWREPRIRRLIWVGLAIGVAVATRYFMLALVPVAVAAIIARRGARPWREIMLAVGTVCLSGLIAFASTTPFFFVDGRTVLKDLAYEARRDNLGTDGLTPFGNLAWYLRTAVPDMLGRTEAFCVLLGTVLILQRRRAEQLLLLAFGSAFLFVICVNHLHWQRWIIPITPIFSLIAASVVLQIQAARKGGFIASAVVLFVILFFPARELWKMGDAFSTGSTRILAGKWVSEHIKPSDGLIVKESMTATLSSSDLPISTVFSLAALRKTKLLRIDPLGEAMVELPENLPPNENKTPEELCNEGYHYAIINRSIAEQYLNSRERYPAQYAFYLDLFSRAHQLKSFYPPMHCPWMEYFTDCGGAPVGIYQLGDQFSCFSSR